MSHDPVRAGCSPVRIQPLHAVLEPITFATAYGDDADPAVDGLRLGLGDVRLEVFVQEQNVPLALEIDARDFEATTVHVLASGADGAPLGAARLLLDPEHLGEVHLGRLAVRRAVRGTGLGVRLVRVVEQTALTYAGVPAGILGESECPARQSDVVGRAGVDDVVVTVMLSAQEQAVGFYRRCGYRVLTAERYLDAGIWHQDMARTLSRP
ncbi:GNAT family N-acetyltransferase [Actinomyces qiguomingii]|uniref:GNAT family N-acetyltransferase n=1 Tax=Actinomyces qiguomingii TaxID=2057800 RepID=UPI000CA0637D|nr:GNAT family N-acetyltransferase [Actinomyces qiguomingii]